MNDCFDNNGFADRFSHAFSDDTFENRERKWKAQSLH